jgi:hypothetical protein
MISIKEIIWKEEYVELVDDYVYYDGILNGHQVIAIHRQYDSNGNGTGYTVYDHIGKTAASDRTEYETLDEAKLVAKKKVEYFVFGLIDMRDYKIDELLK